MVRQPLSRVDDPFFRDLLEYCLGDDLEDGDELIHRTAFVELVVKKFSERHQRLVSQLRVRRFYV